MTEGPGVAVIGMAGRFPGAGDLAEYWDLVLNGGCAVRGYDRGELLASGVPASLVDDPDYVAAGGFLEDADTFDAEMFGMSDREAALTDPQHRLFLQAAWAAMEDSGHPPRGTTLPVGCFATSGMSLYSGSRMSSYLTEAVLADGDLVEGSAVPMISIANRPDYLATRAAYQLGLRGPALSVQTACSSSLVAVHLAVRSLLSGECDLALAGGAAVHVPLKCGYLYQPGGILSRSGRCRPLDAEADGTVGGSGVGVVVLRRLADALAANDPIRAVITGSAINNDGSDKTGFAAPGLAGQRAVITAAHTMARTESGTLGLVEMHGTGTRLGDPLEVHALRLALGPGDGTAHCALGAVKANIGHLDTAAGIAGLIKTVLAVERGVIPPLAGYRSLNPEVDLSGSSLYVPVEARPWPAGPRRAAVSAFGAGGTNAHVVVEQVEASAARAARGGPRLIAVSARDHAALGRSARRLAAHLRAERPDLADVSLTTLAARTPMAAVMSVVAESAEQAADRLDEAVERLTGADARPVPARPRPVVLLFPGQGGQVWPLLHRALADDAAFRASFDSLRAPRLADIAADPEDPRRALAAWVQPALVATSLALALALREARVAPAVVIGHSLGELAAAAAAGVLDPGRAVQLAARRGSLVDEHAEPGRMLAVGADPQETARILRTHRARQVSVAAVNAPGAVVVAGPAPEIERLAAELRREKVRCSVLPTTHAFHSALMDPVTAEFRVAVAATPLRNGAVKVVSTVTGDDRADLADPGHWSAHLRLPVRFADAVLAPAVPANAVFVDLGAEGALADLVAVNRPEAADRLVRLDRFDTAPPVQRLLLGLRGHGVVPDWTATRLTDVARRLALPGYPFASKRHWPSPSRGQSAADASTRLVTVEWRCVPRTPPGALPAHKPVVLVGPGGERDAATLRHEFPGLRILPDWSRTLARGPAAAGQRLISDLQDADGVIDLTALSYRADGTALRSAIALAQAVAAADRPLWCGVATIGAAAIEGAAAPDQAAVWGFVRALRVERRESTFRLVDLGGSGDIRGLGAELASTDGLESALRAGLRLMPMVVDADPKPPLVDRSLDTVLVAGGTGGVGAHLVRLLSDRACRVVVVSRTASRADFVPPPGCVVEFERADVTNPADIERLGRLVGGDRLSLVVAATGVLRDRLADRVTESDLRAVSSPKRRALELLGALAASRSSPVLALSSLAAILGSPGQAAYSAANLALEAVASRLRADGAHVVTLAFGPWQGVGMSAALDGRSGPRALPPAAWLDALGRLPADAAAYYALPTDRSGLTSRNPAPAQVAAAVWTSAPDAQEPNRWETALAEGGVESLVVKIVAEVAGRTADAVSPEVPLADLGLDSLAGLRLRSRLMALTGRDLPATLIYNHPTPRLLAKFLGPAPRRAAESDPAGALAREISLARAALNVRS